MQDAFTPYVQTAAYAPVEERLGFLRKIYGLLSISLMVAIGGAWMVLSNQTMLETVARWQIVFFILEIAAIFFCHWVRHKGELAFIALFGFTFLTGVTLAPLVYVYGLDVAGQAALLTVIIFAALSAYTIISKKDFSFMGGMLFVGLIGLTIGSLLNALFFHSPAGQMMFAYFGVFLFSGFIIYDTSNILKNYPTNEYISATLALYLDILNLFVMLMHILGGNRD